MLLFSEIFILFCIKKEVFEQHKETERPEKRKRRRHFGMGWINQRESGQSVHSLELHAHMKTGSLSSFEKMASLVSRNVQRAIMYSFVRRYCVSNKLRALKEQKDQSVTAPRTGARDRDVDGGAWSEGRGAVNESVIRE